MIYFYTFLFYLLLPFIFMRLWWRSLRQPDYRKRLGERLGRYPFQLDRCICLHAVSVGESLAAIPLIKALKVAYPDLPLLVTTMTPTGSARIKNAFGDSVYHVYLPYDLPFAISRFLNVMNPQLLIIMETELWPNLLAACQKRKIPVCLVNARLSAKSAKGYQRIAPLTRVMMKNLHQIAANGEVDAARFIQLGMPKENVRITGNIKFDLELPADLPAKQNQLRETLGKERFVWIAASTHEGEEDIILAAHAAIRKINPQALLILVPRHPDRFDVIAKQCEQAFPTARRSLQEVCTPETGVYLGDTMGELLIMYAASDVTFVGGSLIPRGGHNILEPGALAKPVLSGPHLFNFNEISQLFLSANALIKVTDANSLSQAVQTLMQDQTERDAMGSRSRKVVDANRGALERQMLAIKQAFPSH